MEWLKEILGDAYTDEIAQKVQAAMETEYAPRGELEAALGSKETFEKQLAEANATIEGMAGKDEEAVQKVATEWKEKYEQLQKESETQIAELRFSGVLGEAVKTAKGLSMVSIQAELGKEKMTELMASKNQAEDIKQALEGLKGEKSFLFEAEPAAPTYAAGTGSGQVLNAGGGEGGLRESVAAALFGDK